MQAPKRPKQTLTTSWVTVAVAPKYEAAVVLTTLFRLYKMQQTVHQLTDGRLS